MTILNTTEARSKLYGLIDETTISHQPIVIIEKRENAILVSEDDWNAINETLYLLSVTGETFARKYDEINGSETL